MVLVGKTLSEYCRQIGQEGFSEESIARSVAFPAFGCLIRSLDLECRVLQETFA